MVEKVIRIEIQIGPRGGIVEWIIKRVVVVTTMSILVMGPIVANHTYFGGGWALDILGGIMGLLLTATIIGNLGTVRRRFDTTDAAAKWVASEEWKSGD